MKSVVKSRVTSIRISEQAKRQIALIARATGRKPTLSGVLPLLLAEGVSSHCSREALEAAARKRIEGDPDLRPYIDIFFEFDWPEGMEHIEWVATAPKKDLVAWAQGVRAQEVSIS